MEAERFLKPHPIVQGMLIGVLCIAYALITLLAPVLGAYEAMRSDQHPRQTTLTTANERGAP